MRIIKILIIILSIFFLIHIKICVINNYNILKYLILYYIILNIIKYFSHNRCIQCIIYNIFIKLLF